MAERDLRGLADQIQNIGIRHPEVGPGFVQKMTADQFRDHVVNSAVKGDLYLWGVKVVIDDAAVSIRCEGAARGAEEYRADQHAGVANSVQAAQGCRLAAGAEGGADLCPLGTADESGFMTAEDKARTAAETAKALRQGHDLRALAIRLQREMGYPFRQLMAGIRWIADKHAQSPKPRFRYDWLLKKWVSAEAVDAVAIGGPLHGQRVSIAATADGLSHRVGRGQVVRYVRHDFTHRIPCPQRYTVLVEERTELPPTWEMRRLAGLVESVRYGQLWAPPYA
ncbi:hypothetical protein [Stenotrophomonas cyclobalanopsidis]|uniref:hypothetical protein n=1 Tax=Stenotrophomonas cyclobalanopsidis TaxID=2771362 RepID=UPI002FD91059